jgi:phosphotransacetylase
VLSSGFAERLGTEQGSLKLTDQEQVSHQEKFALADHRSVLHPAIPHPEIDPKLNDQNGKNNDGRITSGSGLLCLVIPTNEETEGCEPRTVKAVAICGHRGIARCVLFGKPLEDQSVAKSLYLELPDSVQILDPAVVRSNYVNPLFEARKHKGLSMEMAASQLEDNAVLGTMMLALGEVDGLVSGAVHSTANTVRPAPQVIKTKPNAHAVSSIFFVCLPEQVLVYGDCAVIPDPDAETLADIAIESADSAKTFGIPPSVAMISYSTGEYDLQSGPKQRECAQHPPDAQRVETPVNDLFRGALVDDIVYTIALTAIHPTQL